MAIGNLQIAFESFQPFHKNSREVSATTDMSVDDGIIIFTAAATLNMIAVAQFKNRFIVIKNATVADTISLDGNGTETVNGNLVELLDEPGMCVVLTPIGTDWMIVSKYIP